MSAVDHAKSRSASPNFADSPLMNGSGGEARIDGAEGHEQGRGQQLRDGDQADVERTRGRSKPSRIAPIAMPTRNRTRMIVNTYVELPVPAPMSRFQTTW